LAIRGTYTYCSPDNLLPGTRVLVPLGQKTAVGIILGEGKKEAGLSIRTILQALDAIPVLTPAQLTLWQWMASYYLCPIGDVMAAALPSKALDHQYTLNETSRRRVRLASYTDSIQPIQTLTAAQQQAYQSIRDSWQQHETVLLQGVTSSGKTEVYMHLIADYLQQGQQVLLLVPEIALTTQLTARLERVFGNQLRVYHSRISDAQRIEIYRQQLLDDQPRLIVGARSAVFLPFQHLGLVIVDEEHEPSYKQQDPAPRYHARSVVAMLAHQVGAKVLLGTATPSLESRYNAEQGKYGYVTLSERYKGLQLPHITLIDLKRQYHRKEMYDHFSDPLVARIQEELSKHKQIILFQNRRGYAPFIQCAQCGAVVKCPDCDVSMTVHMATRQLVCHYCGHTTPVPTHCSQCGGEMRIHGFGTERLEEEVHQLFPTARVGRMDLDTTRKKNDYEDIITAFSNHEMDILIGTQMVTKGLHFDDVSLVAVLSADHLLSQPDFRATERAFQMLEQVSGRAGRKGQQGQVIIQTYDPNNPIFSRLQQHDVDGLYQQEITEREHYHFPPFSRQISILLRHTNEQRLLTAAATLHCQLRAVFGHRITDVITPNVARVQRQYIRQMNLRVLAKANLDKAKQLLMDQVHYVESLPSCKGIQILLDVDPM